MAHIEFRTINIRGRFFKSSDQVWTSLLPDVAALVVATVTVRALTLVGGVTVAVEFVVAGAAVLAGVDCALG